MSPEELNSKAELARESAAIEADLLHRLACERQEAQARAEAWLLEHGAPFPFFSPSCRLPEPLIDLDRPQNPMVPQSLGQR